MQEENAAELIKRVLNKERLTQAELAIAAGVHQSTVSRILEKKDIRRQGKARARLLEHVHNLLSGELDKGKQKVITAFDSVWDGSEAHAAAIARVIGATADLRPLKHRKGPSSR